MAMPGTVARPRSHSVAALTLLLGTLFIYAPVWNAALVYEDNSAVVETTLVQPRPPIAWTRTRALTRASYALDRAIGGTRAIRMLHVTNVVIHLANGLLVALLAWQLTRHRGVTWLAAAIFLWHPLQTEAVSYIAGRTELLSAFGVLLACTLALSQIRYRHAFVVVALLLACYAKESAVCGVGLVWLLLANYRALPPLRTVYKWVIVFVLAVVALSVSVIVKEYRVQADLGHLEYAGMQAFALGRYVALLVIPWHQSVDHSFELYPIWTRYVALIGLLTVLALAFLVITMLSEFDLITERRRLIIVGVAWAAVALVLRFVMRIPEVLNEHQLYLAMAGTALAVSAALAWPKETAPHAVPVPQLDPMDVERAHRLCAGGDAGCPTPAYPS